MDILLILIFLVLIYMLKWLKSSKKKNFNFRVLTALVVGLIFGGLVQLFFGSDSETTNGLVVFMSIFADGYITLLKMIVIPLILVAMTTSIMNAENSKTLAKIAPKIIAVLMITVSIAAVIGVSAVYVTGIDSPKIVESAQTDAQAVNEREASLVERQEMMEDMTYADYVTSIIPSNVFYMFTGQDSTSTLSTVLFGMFLGYAVLQIKKRKPEKAQPFIDFMNSLREVILSMVREILKLTPFGILALMATFMATSSVGALSELIKFLIASYLAIIAMYGVHILIIALNGLSPMKFIKKTWPTVLFSFGSRSSMAALPLNIQAQTDELGVDSETANMSATFGASIGQNGCAGIYPAMVAIMAAQIMGIDITLAFLIKLVVVIAISSFGIAGVGGGATFAAIAVLTIMGLDITIAAILVSIEPAIDMARTALNVSDSMLAGVIVAKRNKTLDEKVYNS